MASRLETTNTIEKQLKVLIDTWCDQCAIQPIARLGCFYDCAITSSGSDTVVLFFEAVEDTLRNCKLSNVDRQQLLQIVGWSESKYEYVEKHPIEPTLWGNYTESKVDPNKATVELLNQLCLRHKVKSLSEILPEWFGHSGSRSGLLKLRDKIAKYGLGYVPELDGLAIQIIESCDAVLEPKRRYVEIEPLLDELLAPFVNVGTDEKCKVCNPMLRYRLPTLLIVLALGPPVLAAGWYVFSRAGLAGLGLILPIGLMTCYLLAWCGVFALLRAADRTDE